MKAAPDDVIIVGGGHNGLVAAAYLARAGRRVTVLEARGVLGGAVAGDRIFPGVDARLSRFSYLVSLLPRRIVHELGLDIELRSRPVRSYTPVGDGGVLISGEAAEVSRLDRGLQAVATVLEPTLTQPLPRAADLQARLDPELWAALVERPIGALIESSTADDTARGVLLTDALIGTFSYAHDPSLRQNRCFLYHVIGSGTGEWRVPVGGMGAIADELVRAANRAGARLVTNAPVVAIEASDSGPTTIRLADGQVRSADHVLVNCGPAVLDRLVGMPSSAPVGSQLKINMLLRRLPRLRSGLDPEVGFAGTLHLGQGYARLQQAYEVAAAGRIPDPLPCEVYCHTLTDRSILGPALRDRGYHTLTLFGLHTPIDLFRADPGGAREQALQAALRALQDALAEPLEDCLAVDGSGRPCLEVMTPLDIEAELNMPGGHIFHGDLDWPWLADDLQPANPAERWGVATRHPGVLWCGSGARRGGAVSGLGGHNAAMAVLEAG
ncbi:MAG TPA: NAD(P)/FAD-dependent oxidoreductase [Propionibacteriaceae bacterium]|nr:NAD(P)/FAD-dependent oxidoreductase [Propionibacteriaceae bacterium]